MSQAIILDTETTGLDDPDFLEVAYIGIKDIFSLAIESEFCQRYKPSKQIGFGAMATHHISPQDVENCPPSSTFVFPSDVEYVIGHNIDFDWRVIKQPNVKRICTQALARSIWPKCDSHSLVALIYLTHTPDKAKALTKNAHSALIDVKNCLRILPYLILDMQLGPNFPSKKPQSWEELWQISEAARIPTIMPFGKHKGMEIKSIDRSYLRWLEKEPDVDPYLKIAAKNVLQPNGNPF